MSIPRPPIIVWNVNLVVQHIIPNLLDCLLFSKSCYYNSSRPNNTCWLTFLNSGVLFNKSSTIVDVVSHHSVLQVHLGPTGEEQLYHISMSTATGPHEGSSATLEEQNETRQWISHVMNVEGNNGKFTLAVSYSLPEANDSSESTETRSQWTHREWRSWMIQLHAMFL